MYKADENLRKVQLRSLQIMKYLHSFMVENDINYSICGGTAIGAIVHSGFIPWDDDIDICLDRLNYEKFLNLFDKQGQYQLDNYHNNESSRILISKVLDRKTKIIFTSQYGEEISSSIFVDVSVFDRIPTNKLKRRTQLLLADIAQLTINKYPPSNSGNLTKILGTLYLKLIPHRCIPKICSGLEKRISKYANENNFLLSELLLNRNGTIIFPANLLDNLILVDFEDTELFIFKQYDIYLTIKYGEKYKVIPDISEQHPHHNIKNVIIDGESI